MGRAAFEGDFYTGYEPRECGDHRSTGSRAWCFECTEWCYPKLPCKGCEIAGLRREPGQVVVDLPWLYQKIAEQLKPVIDSRDVGWNEAINHVLAIIEGVNVAGGDDHGSV